MRVTQHERFEKRLQLWDCVFSCKVPKWLRRRRCVECSDDVLDEIMWRFRVGDNEGTWWNYLCLTCALSKEDALAYWSQYEDES